MEKYNTSIDQPSIIGYDMSYYRDHLETIENKQKQNVFIPTVWESDSMQEHIIIFRLYGKALVHVRMRVRESNDCLGFVTMHLSLCALRHLHVKFVLVYTPIQTQ